MADMAPNESVHEDGSISGTRLSQPPLAGVRVLDFTHVIAGPFATTMLADLGAEVVKVERPGTGDDLRSAGRYPGREDHEDMFNANNRSKKSVTVDLKHADGRALCQRLAAVADVVVENFAPGTVARLGMGWEDLRRLNPRLVYCSLSGFGQTGPYSNRLALDILIQAMSGLMSVTGTSDGPPLKAGAPLGDVISGIMASYAILGALYAVKREGVGRYIDVSMQGSLLAALGPRMSQALHAGVAADRIGNENPMRVPSNSYLTEDGHWLAIHVNSQRHWAPFCRALECEEWIDDPRFETMRKRAENRDVMNDLVARRFRERRLADWCPRLEAERVPYAPVLDYAEAVDDAQTAHREQILELTHPTSGPVRTVGPPWIMTGPQAAAFAPPILGQHTEEVLRDWLGLDDADIGAIPEGVFGTAEVA